MYERLLFWYDYFRDLFRPWYAKSELRRRMRLQAVTCDELADYLFAASGRKGGILHIDAGTIRNSAGRGQCYSREFVFHEVYTDGTHVIDPKYRLAPVLRTEYEALIKRLNPDGVEITFRVPQG